VDFFCSDERKTHRKIKAHLVAKRAERTSARSIAFFYTIIENVLY
jgi:hypothetical protein